MPKKAIFTKDHIHKKAFELFEKHGLEAITARNLAKALNSSPAPIYSCYASMDELKKELIDEAKDLFMEYVVKPETESIFLNSGIGLCTFAREEKQLFTSIFLREKAYKSLLIEFRDLMKEEMSKDERFKGLPCDFKDELFLECWFYGHGFATLIATGYFENPTNEFIKEKLMSGAATMLYKRIKDYKRSR
ncbi:TetR/AcrR family transcriptional regulator [Cetobacterium sp. SF1]|uniref:TetR/AcrR family transcriptional regulator n=1 Tax=unclassified Cetobacterium TaxID=2630983 RepID=UPI003CEFA2E2